MMKKFNLTDGIFLAAAALLFVLRIWAGREVGVFIIAESGYDDMLMIRYADLYDHFIAQTLPYNVALVKDIGFSILLNFVKLSGLAYTDFIAVLYFVAAALMVVLFYFVTGVKDRRIWFMIFAFVLFTPAAFSYPGRRLYRNSAMIPMYFIVLELITLLFVIYWGKLKLQIRQIAAVSLALGLTFTLTFYMKEDGLWLLMCLAAVILLCAVRIIFSQNFNAAVPCIAVLLIPLIIFGAGTVIYKSLNYKFFDVYLINNRTEGELGRFSRNVYRVDSQERSAKIWAPADALVKIFDASETLRANPKLRDAVLHTGWFGGDISKNQIHGDFLTWVMLTALSSSGTCHDALEQENFLKKVNDELSDAFDSGKLQKADRFQLVSSMGGMTLKEIFNLRKLIGKTYLTHLALYGYAPLGGIDGMVIYPANSSGVVDEEIKSKYRERVLKASEFTNMDFLSEKRISEGAVFFTKVLFKIYAALNISLFTAALVGLVRALKARKDFLMALIVIGNFLLALVYAFAIAWFSYFLGYPAIPFYSIGIIPMLMTFEILGACLFYRNRRR